MVQVAQEISPAVGAEILGVDLNSRLDDATISFLQETFDDRGLLLFRNVHIDRPYQYYLSEILRGHVPPSAEEARAGAAQQDTFTISNKVEGAAAPFGRLLYHCDGMWSGEPFEVLSLYGVEVEAPALPTSFASSAYAWDTLPDDLRERIEGLHTVHVTGPEYIHERRQKAFAGELSQGSRAHSPSMTMPLVYLHPRTGHSLLNVLQGMTRDIPEFSSEESEDLLDELFAHLYRPEVSYEHYWRDGDLVLWDNLAVQHGRPNVMTSGPARTLRKIGLPLPTDVSSHLIDSYREVAS